MSTQEERRRAIGEAMTAKRGTGEQMAARRGTGEQMAARRNGKEIVNAIGALVPEARQRKTLDPVPPKGSLPSRMGKAFYDPAQSGGGGGGINGPLTETDASTREYWPAGLTSSDGLFVLPAIKTLNLVDADDAPVQIRLADPAGTA